VGVVGAGGRQQGFIELRNLEAMTVAVVIRYRKFLELVESGNCRDTPERDAFLAN
jgi:hypothetical protein